MANPINLINHSEHSLKAANNWLIYQQNVTSIHDNLHADQVSATGWLADPFEQNHALLLEINWLVEEIKERADVLIVIGIGGSYNGTRALEQALSPYFNETKMDIYYAGHHLSGAYMERLLQVLQKKNPFLYVVSKSGATLETLLAFRVLTQFMKTKYGQSYCERILIATDGHNSLLNEVARHNEYRSLPIPSNIGGRYSLFTVVSLFPLAVLGIDIIALLKGASKAAQQLSDSHIPHNLAYQYAIFRNESYKKGYKVELLASFEPSLTAFHEWWKQLFGESEGKQQKGLFPSSASFSTDLHSLGQFVQQGSPILFETMLSFQHVKGDSLLSNEINHLERLNDLSHYSFNDINRYTKDGVIAAHVEANVPVMEITINKLDAYHMGYLCYFFMKASAMSASLLGVNPFDQPGVEHYKRKTLELLKNSAIHSMK